jgi:hypothetical protein
MEGYPYLLSSGAPDSPVRHRITTVACPVRDFLLNRAQSTVAPRCWFEHRTLSGAHRTLSGASSRSLKQPRVTRWSRGRPLARALLAHRTVRWIIATSPCSFSRERRVRRGRLTGWSGAPPDSPVNYSCAISWIPESGHFTVNQPGTPDCPVVTSLAHRTLSGAPPDSPVCQA